MMVLALVHLVAKGRFDEISHKFLVSGHSFLPCDRDFAMIEKRKRVKELEIRLPCYKNTIDDHLVILLRDCTNLKQVRFQGRLASQNTFDIICRSVFVDQPLRPVYVIDVHKLTPSNGPKERSRRARDLTVASDNLSAIEFRPGDFFFNVEPVIRNEATHRKIVFRVGILA
ncbi:hypothetical protein ANN_21832 [Periplaneta americana]|uniref:Uncharacterized protein n=1 Tax=Periplaneta americana TaxID=6978 RepID=A0ABQ8S6X9_PERAM|nr:hypothetical protein ANN_21832 [Periplaneta americana]